MAFRNIASVLILTVLASGCAAPASSPPSTQPQAYEVPEGSSLLLLRRSTQVGGSANAYAIRVNGVEAAEMAAGDVATSLVGVGEVRVEARTMPNILNVGLGLLLMSRPTLEFTAEEGLVYPIDVTSDMTGGPALTLGAPQRGAAPGTGLAPVAAASERTLVVSLPPEPAGPAPAAARDIAWRGVRDDRTDQIHIGRRVAAFGVSMGFVRSDPPPAEVVADVVSRALRERGLRPVAAEEGPGLQAVLRAFWFETDTTPLYWDVRGDVRLTLSLTGDGAARSEELSCAATERTYVWPDADIFRAVIRRCLGDIADGVRGSALLARPAA